ncbi:hypothetical protein, partial [Lachnoclostridium sp. An14]|uniref:hypothetical protein n=1 Tax=Lachnoclostridium sp. An14 TaxID=1965562 RepID=UPI0019503D7C
IWGEDAVCEGGWGYAPSSVLCPRIHRIFSISRISHFRTCEISFPDVSLSVRVHTILGTLHICLASSQISLSAPGSHITDAYGFHLLERN